MESSVGIPVCHDIPGKLRSDSRHIAQKVFGRCIQVHTHCIHAGFHSIVQFLLQPCLVHIVLVLAYAEILGIYFNELGERIHQPAAYRDRTAHRDIFVRELRPPHFRGGIYGSTVFAYGPQLAAIRQAYLAEEFYGLPACSSVAYGHRLYPILLQHILHGHQGLDFFILGRVREDDCVIQEFALRIQAGNFAAVPESGIHRHRPFLPHRRAKQQLTQILSENGNALSICPGLGFLDDFARNGGLQKPLETVVHGFADLLREFSSWIAVLLAIVVVYFLAAALRICVYGYVQEPFLPGSENGKQIMGRNPVERTVPIEVGTVFGGSRAVRSLGSP